MLGTVADVARSTEPLTPDAESSLAIRALRDECSKVEKEAGVEQGARACEGSISQKEVACAGPPVATTSTRSALKRIVALWPTRIGGRPSLGTLGSSTMDMDVNADRLPGQASTSTTADGVMTARCVKLTK